MRVFITGGTTGIGFALAKRYLDEGADVAVCGRDLKKIPSSMQNSYPKLVAFELDITNQAAVNKAITEFGKKGLDLVVANAGISIGNKSSTLDYKLARDVINTNLIGVLNTFEAATEIMIPKKKGHLVAIASVAGLMGLPGAGPYCASKAGVLKLCESLAIDLKKYGITVSAIAPGFIDTPLTQKNNHPMPFMIDAEKASKIIKEAIGKKKILYIFPLPMKLIVLFLEKIPRALYRFIMSKTYYSK